MRVGVSNSIGNVELDHLPPAVSEQEFDHYFYMIEAAAAGLGVAIGPWAFVQRDLASGLLTFRQLVQRNPLVGGPALPPLDGGGELNVVPRTGPSGSYSLNRLPQLCATESGGNAGAPQLRLSKLAQHFKGRGGVEVSLCDEGSYASALNGIDRKSVV